jgi:hypothetical protein
MDLGRAAYLVDKGRPTPEQRDRFARTFHVPVGQFRDALGWFDVMAFDDWLGEHEGSMLDVVEERFGADAAQLCRDMAVHPGDVP